MNKICNDKFKSYAIVYCVKTITNLPNNLLIRTLAADEELGSSKRVQITLRNLAPHNPSNWSIYKHTYHHIIHQASRAWDIVPPNPQVGYCLFMHHFPFSVCLRNSLDYPWPARGRPPGGARRLSAACRRSTARGRGRSGPSTPAHPRSPGQ